MVLPEDKSPPILQVSSKVWIGSVTLKPSMLFFVRYNRILKTLYIELFEIAEWICFRKLACRH